MRFQFTRDAEIAGGLSIIPVIPDHQLSTVEGRNGIGKTLAARVLELITGGEPFAALPNAWKSLCEDLGRLTVTIDKFPTGEVVRCEIDSSEWIGRTERDVAAKPGLIYINDSEATWDELRSLIMVRRIAGDEGLSETLGRTLREAGVVAQQREASVNTAVEFLGDKLRPFTDDFVGISGEALSRDRDQFVHVSEQYRTAADALRSAKESVARKEADLAEHQETAASLRTLPMNLDRYDAALSDFDAAMQMVQSADARLTSFGRQQVIEEGKADTLAWYQRRLPYRMRHLAAARFREAQLLNWLGLEGRLADWEIAQDVRQTQQALTKVQEAIRTGDLAGTISQTQRVIETELKALPHAARDQHIATIERRILVHELADGIAVRRQELQGVPKPEEVKEHESSQRELQRRLDHLRQLPEAVRTTEQKRKLVDEANREIRNLTGSDSLGAAYEAAQQGVDEARASLLDASVALRKAQAEIDGALGRSESGDTDLEADPDQETEAAQAAGTSTEDVFTPATLAEVQADVMAWLTARLGELDASCNQRLSKRESNLADRAGTNLAQHLAARIEVCLDVVASHQEELTGGLAEALHEHGRVQAELDAIARHLERVEESTAARLGSLASAIAALTDPAGAWSAHAARLQKVVEAFGLSQDAFAALARHGHIGTLVSPPNEVAEPVEAARVVETIVQIVAEVESSAVREQNAWSIAAGYLYRVSADLSPRLDRAVAGAAGTPSHVVPALQRWVERSLSALLSAPELRSELFGNSETVGFNLVDQTVIWTEKEGQRRRRRPVEAFSSGQQVFAYTRAKLERLRGLRTQTTHVVVFLDEFGAFVARDRFAQLMNYIEHNAVGKIADQIVVTVPLSADIDQVVANAETSEVSPDRFDDRGYVVVPALSA